MNRTSRALCASALSGVMLLGASSAGLRPVGFSTDRLGEFMDQGPAPQDAASLGYKINFAKSAAQNNLRKGRATKAVVEVRDRNNKPVAGVAILFLLPSSGPSGTFAAGATSLTVTTNAAGQAIASYAPNQLAGMFNLTATANVNGVTVGTATVSQANVAAAAAAAGAGMSGTTIGIIAGVAAAAAAGIGLAAAGGNSSTPASTPTVVTPPPTIRIIGGGVPVFGPKISIPVGRGR